MAKPHCLYDIFIPYYQSLLQQGSGDQPWTCDSMANTLGLERDQIRSRCLNKMRGEGYIENAETSTVTNRKKRRGNFAGYGKTPWVFTQKFKTFAAANATQIKELVII